MNFHLIGYTLGNYLMFFSGCFVPSICWAYYYQERQMQWLFIVITIITGVGGYIMQKCTIGKGKGQQFTRREGLFTVCLIWIISGIIGALPFYFSSHIDKPISALFESISGFTTTGASVLSDIESLPQSLLFWRSFTHWMGGLGIVVLFILLLPHLGIGVKVLFRSEMPGPKSDVLKPKIRETAFTLFKIYLFFTLLQTMLLLIFGISLFDSLCHSFGTIATAGYSTKNTSIAHFQSLQVEIIIIIFMFLCGINFSLYYYFLQGNRKVFHQDTEFKVYVAMILISTLAISLDLYWHYQPDLGKSIREATFQVVSIQTTTGFTTADFDKWPGFSKLILAGLMFVGGCAGSTAGSMKVIRWVIIFKYIYNQIESVFRPDAIRPMRLGGKVLEEDVVKGVIGLFCLWIVIFGAVSLAIAAMGFDIVTSTAATAATLNNIGPAFAQVGPMMNYSVVPEAGKFLFIICMLFGRLEIYTLIILFHPAFWQK